MRRLVRTSVLASTAVLAAAIGAVSFAPMASAQPEGEAPVGPLGSVVLESPDLIVSTATVCDTTDEEGPEGGVVALEVTVENAGSDPAANVTTNYAAFPGIQAAQVEELIEPGQSVTYRVPSADREWVSVPVGAAAFSTQLDANFLDNLTGGLLSYSCVPAPAPDAE